MSEAIDRWGSSEVDQWRMCSEETLRRLLQAQDEIAVLKSDYTALLAEVKELAEAALSAYSGLLDNVGNRITSARLNKALNQPLIQKILRGEE